mmetsp:Transcript_16115/g.40413  ORF Transcript_16115/g.40413 Transcript_16115/m.40413 type:complete len:275 (-) Transcript_16115:3479-4303(-)
MWTTLGLMAAWRRRSTAAGWWLPPAQAWGATPRCSASLHPSNWCRSARWRCPRRRTSKRTLPAVRCLPRCRSCRVRGGLARAPGRPGRRETVSGWRSCPSCCAATLPSRALGAATCSACQRWSAWTARWPGRWGCTRIFCEPASTRSCWRAWCRHGWRRLASWLSEPAQAVRSSCMRCCRDRLPAAQSSPRAICRCCAGASTTQRRSARCGSCTTGRWSSWRRASSCSRCCWGAARPVPPRVRSWASTLSAGSCSSCRCLRCRTRSRRRWARLA